MLSCAEAAVVDSVEGVLFATTRSLSVSSSDQGLKSTAPSVTLRPSFSDAIFSICDLAIVGTAAQASAQNASNPPSDQAARRRQTGERDMSPALAGSDVPQAFDLLNHPFWSSLLVMGSYWGQTPISLRCKASYPGACQGHDEFGL